MLQTCLKPSTDFDFLMGIWTVRHRYLRRRLQECQDWVEFDGVCAARKILEGFGNMDEGDIALPGDRYRGMTLRTYDAARDLWSIHWFDSRCPARLFPPMTGRFSKGIGTFHGDDECDGRPIRVRFYWSHITLASARWTQAFSADGGKSWEMNWIMDFTRL
jgi:hypothetical protein